MSEDFGPNAKQIPTSELKEIGKVQALKPVEADFKGRPGYWQKPKPEGGYEWGYSFTPNDGHGRLTREAEMVGEMLKPFQRADTERHARLQSQVERVAVKDDAGSVHFLEPHAADLNADKNGWHSAGRIIGLLARRVFGDFCERCDRRRSWCECR